MYSSCDIISQTQPNPKSQMKTLLRMMGHTCNDWNLWCGRRFSVCALCGCFSFSDCFFPYYCCYAVAPAALVCLYLTPVTWPCMRCMHMSDFLVPNDWNQINVNGNSSWSVGNALSFSFWYTMLGRLIPSCCQVELIIYLSTFHYGRTRFNLSIR